MTSAEHVSEEVPSLPLSPLQIGTKRAFDLLGATVGLIISAPIILLAYVAASLDTGSSGFFRQERVGRFGRPFSVIKIRTMRNGRGPETNVTTKDDPRITRLGRFFRRTKIDELPQLINVFKGEMSFVGPRPDVPGYADRLHGEDRVVLALRPGITGPATLAFRDEEQLLAEQPDPDAYNDEVLYPRKVAINRKYIEEYSLVGDLRTIFRTVFGR